MNSQQIATVLYSVAGLAALWFVAVSWCAYKTEKLRQDVFHLRAELFDYAATGAVSFYNPSYRRLRTILNSMIRFAHEVSFIRVAVSVVLEKLRPVMRELPNFVEHLEADRELSDESREKLRSLHNSLMLLVAWKIMTTSLVALPVLVVGFVLHVLANGLPQPDRDTATRVPTPAQQLLSDRRVTYHIQLIEQQAIETRERKLAIVAAG